MSKIYYALYGNDAVQHVYEDEDEAIASGWHFVHGPKGEHEYCDSECLIADL